jgi:hypothetical protein
MVCVDDGYHEAHRWEAGDRQLGRLESVLWKADTSKVVKSVSRPLVDFGVLNGNLIKGLTSCVKRISRF